VFNVPTRILYHGYTLAAHPGLNGVERYDGKPAGEYPHRDWEEVCIGTRERPGRARRVLELARDSVNLTNIIFSTGASWLTHDGQKTMTEAWYCAERLFELAPEYGLDPKEFRRTALFDEVSPTTFGTIVEVAKWYRDGKLGFEQSYLLHVASSNHSERVLRDAVKEPFEDLPFVIQGFYPAATGYAGGHPRDTIVDDLGKSYCLKADVRNAAREALSVELAAHLGEILGL
jgi:hypothetical protein